MYIQVRTWLRGCCLSGILLAFSVSVNAQDAIFSQFYNATLYLNPAMAGFDRNTTVQLNYRSQWNQLAFPYRTQQASLIVPIYQDKHAKPFGHLGGVGLSVYGDQAGAGRNYQTYAANLNLAYNLPLDPKQENQISFGLQSGIINRRLDTEDLQWGSQYNQLTGFDASIPPPEGEFENNTFLDLGVGLFWSYSPDRKVNTPVRGANFGISAAHINNPDQSLLQNEEQVLETLYKVHGGMIFGLTERASVSLNVLAARQNEQDQVNTGAYFSYTLPITTSATDDELTVRLGGWHRFNDAIILLTEFETRAFKLGVSYDWNSSTLNYRDLGIGTYELHLALRFGALAPAKIRY